MHACHGAEISIPLLPLIANAELPKSPVFLYFPVPEKCILIPNSSEARGAGCSLFHPGLYSSKIVPLYAVVLLTSCLEEKREAKKEEVESTKIGKEKRKKISSQK